MSPKDLTQIEITETGLNLPLPSGEIAYFNAYWLRDNCGSSIDPQTRERIFDITELGHVPRIAAAAVDGDQLVLDWAGEDHRTTYSMAMLDAFSAKGAMPDPADLPRNLWEAGYYDHFTRLSQEALDNDPDARRALARALIVDGIALVTGMEDSNEGLTRLVNTLGPVTPSADSDYFDVQLKINPINLAYTAGALELHTDLPSEEAAPGVQFLHCRRNSVEGGRSVFVDGAAVAEAFRLTNPDDFELLATHPIPFFRRHDHIDYRSHQYVIELDKTGAVEGLTISQHLADAFDLPQRVLDSYYPAFCRFIHALKDPRFVNHFRLNAGECIVFDNHRIVHGREAFTAESGERHLRGCYTDRGAVRSTYRVLSRG